MIDGRSENKLENHQSTAFNQAFSEVLDCYRPNQANTWTNLVQSLEKTTCNTDSLPQVTLEGHEKPHSPVRHPDHVTADGAKLWGDGHGHIACIKTENGEIFKFDYDRKGQLDAVREPDGSRLERQGDHWERTNAKGEKHSFQGQVVPGKDGSVVYQLSSGEQTRFNGDGSIVESQSVDGKRLIAKMTDARGASTSISYDAGGQPFAIEGPDQSWLVKGTDNNWYRSVPGSGTDSYQPISIERDELTGNVTIKGKGYLTALTENGVRESARS